MSIIENNPLISIALATYNGEEYLAAQLDTLINQTYKNLEIVICDDCSKDSTPLIIEEYQKRDSRIKFYPNSENLGFNLNFERAFKLCNGDYIAISDQDDIWMLDKIEIVLKAWENGVVLAHHSAKPFVADPLPNILITNEVRAFSGNQIETLLKNNTVQGCTIVFKRELLKFALPLSRNVLYDWWLSVCAVHFGSIGYIHQNLIFHRRHLNSSHYSAVTSKAKFDSLQESILLLDLVAVRLSLSDEQLAFVQQLQSVVKQLQHKGFSIEAFLFFFKNGEFFYSRRKKRFSFFSYFIRSFRESWGG